MIRWTPQELAGRPTYAGKALVLGDSHAVLHHSCFGGVRRVGGRGKQVLSICELCHPSLSLHYARHRLFAPAGVLGRMVCVAAEKEKRGGTAAISRALSDRKSKRLNSSHLRISY